MQNYILVEITVNDNDLKDQLIAILSLIKIEGVEEKENKLLVYINETEYEQTDMIAVLSQFNVPYSTTFVPSQNWNALWESNFEPIVVDDFCAIRAGFHEPFTNTKHEIIITPKMSFGTGHHATTYLMIQQMAFLDLKQKNVADSGTGTGILAILAEKLGAKEILAIDYDEWSIENTRENIERNNCNNINVLKADHFTVNKKYDVILANINKNVIVDNIDALVSGLTPGGQLLLSGLLKQDESEVVTAFEAKGLTCETVTERNNWITILLRL